LQSSVVKDMGRHYTESLSAKLTSAALESQALSWVVCSEIAMRFRLIDRIVDIEPGVRITAVKALTGAEDYLKDHFPLFPVMPGVLMLEAMFQAAAWLVRRTDDFGYALVLLKEARNVKYSDFVAPGQVLTVTAELMKQDGPLVTLKTSGTVDGETAVSARLILERSHVASHCPQRATTDPYTRKRMQEFYDELYQPANAQAIA
jgi:3-hydroxyacyl-[acyl-carrier-protein] dehydratase